MLTDAEVRNHIRRQRIGWAGNARLKIYGSLRCTSGKRMNRKNRVFFRSQTEALVAGFRPCGHCQRRAYKTWKHGPL